MRIVALLALVLALPGCAMTRSSIMLPAVDPYSGNVEYKGEDEHPRRHVAGRRGGDGPAELRCRSSLGAYYLSRSLIRVRLEEHDYSNVDAATLNARQYGVIHKIVVEGPETVADKGKAYCLDFLASPTSNDIIKVSRNAESLLLEVGALADDQSVEIAKKIIDIIFIGLSGDPAFTPFGRTDLPRPSITTLLEVAYDPTVPLQAALLNERLRDYGFCIILEGEQPEKQQQRAAYCDNPMGFVKKKDLDDEIIADTPPPKAAQEIGGLFYRPRQPYSLRVFKQADRKFKGGWKLEKLATVNLENSAPILGVGVNRTFFAKRRTRLVFEEGRLKDVELDKTSELLGMVDIPLYLAQSLVALPSAIIKVDIDLTTQQTQVIGYELELLQKIQQRRQIEDEIRKRQQQQLANGKG